MICTLKIKLVPDKEQYNDLLGTMKQFNQACDTISKIAYDNKICNKFGLQKICYYDIREQYKLPSQLTIRAISKVIESYKTDKKFKSLHQFKNTGAIVYDQRILSFQGFEFASITTINKRIKVPIVLGGYHQGLLCGHRIRGQADLIFQDKIFYLMVIVDVPEKPEKDISGYIGVDLGIKNIAVDNTGEIFSGAKLNGLRHRHKKLRAKLQSKGTKSAKHLLKKRKRKEYRMATDINHCISKKIVQKAQRHSLGIALEDLSNIRKKTVVRKSQRSEHSSWAFYQLRTFIQYKAKIAGVPVVFVNPAYTSQACPICNHISKSNRPNRDFFLCQNCGFAGHADIVAAQNVSNRASVNKPYVEQADELHPVSTS